VFQDFWIARHWSFLRQMQRWTKRQMITNKMSSQFPVLSSQSNPARVF
jgi:hypothetical protein